jgi:putative phosphoribosyl transferase
MFRDRHAAGLALAHALYAHTRRAGVVVLGMARGGVMVAAPVARALVAPLDTFVCRKLGVPGLEEVAFGAIAEGDGAPVFDAVHSFIGLSRKVVTPVLERERREIERRVKRYRDGKRHIDLFGKTVIVVDDGLASGATLRAAGIALRRHRPARIIAAVPVASGDGVRFISPTFDDVLSLTTPTAFGTVSDWYHDFTPVDDTRVRELLNKPARVADDPASERAIDTEHQIAIPIDAHAPTRQIIGDLSHYGTGMEPPRGLVIFAHGGGSSRASYRNRYLAARLRLAGWATLRLDLLIETERAADATGAFRFDVPLITARLLAATQWCISERVPGCERLVLFGASTGAAAAMGVAAALADRVAAVVARGGRIDLAAPTLARVRAPTLLVVGGNDQETLRLTEGCQPLLGAAVTVRVIPGAGHTFGESGTLGRLGEVVTSWLTHQQHKARVARWISMPAAWLSRAGSALHKV